MTPGDIGDLDLDRMLSAYAAPAMPSDLAARIVAEARRPDRRAAVPPLRRPNRPWLRRRLAMGVLLVNLIAASAVAAVWSGHLPGLARLAAISHRLLPHIGLEPPAPRHASREPVVHRPVAPRLASLAVPPMPTAVPLMMHSPPRLMPAARRVPDVVTPAEAHRRNHIGPVAGHSRPVAKSMLARNHRVGNHPFRERPLERRGVAFQPGPATARADNGLGRQPHAKEELRDQTPGAEWRDGEDRREEMRQERGERAERPQFEGARRGERWRAREQRAGGRGGGGGRRRRWR